MSGHRKRIRDAERFAETTQHHHRLQRRVSCDHYRAMCRLHDALLQAIIDVTGKEAPWIYRSNSAPRATFDQN